MDHPDIVVIGASAGGVDALRRLVAELPADLHASVFVVLHLSPHLPSQLPEILSRSGKLPAVHAKDGDSLDHGKIYIAPPDYHMLLHTGGIRVIRGPKENRHRPAIDPLFRSAASAFGPRVIGVLLTGNLDDGVSGFIAIRKAGGILMIQDPQEARFPEMPLNASKTVDVDYVLPLSALGAQIVMTINEEMDIHKKPSADKEHEFETKISELDLRAISDEKDHMGEPSVFGCPSCKGVLWEIKEGELVRYRCRVGHAFSPEGLVTEQGEVIEQALWTALTTLEERASFLHKMASESHRNQQVSNFRIYEKRIQDVEEKAESIRKILLDSEHYSGLKPTEKERSARKG